MVLSTLVALQSPAAAAPPAASPLVEEDSKKPVELLGAATETMRATRHPGGRVTVETWSQPVRVKQPTGAWAWIDTTLTEQNGVIRPKAAKTATELSGGGADRPLVTFHPRDSQSVSLGWPTPLPRPTIQGNKATYADAAGLGTDLVLTVLPTGFRQEIILRAKPAKPLNVKLSVKADGLKLRTRKDGRIELADTSGATVTQVFHPTFSAIPSRGKQAAAKLRESRRVKTTLTTGKDQQSLVIAPDASLFDDPSVKYPVTIGSALTTLGVDVDVADDGYAGDPTRAVLTAGTIFGIPNRAYLRFDTNAFIGNNIVDAKLSLLNVDAPGCGDIVGDGIQVRRVTSRWNGDDLTWATKPSSTDEGAQTVTKAFGPECDPGRIEWPITDLASSWAAGSGNFGLELRAADEASGDDNWRMLASAEYGGPDETPKLTATFESFGERTIVHPAGSDGVEVFTAPALWRRSLPMAEAQAHALDVADTRVASYSSALAPPLVDMVTGEVITPATTAEGTGVATPALAGTAYLNNGGAEWSGEGEFEGALESDEDGDGVPAVGEPFTFNPRVPMVTNSAARLNSISTEILRLDPEIPGADKLIAASIWEERNQVMVQASEVTPELRLGLAQRYGATTVSIWLRPGVTRPVPTWDPPKDPDVSTWKCPLNESGKERDCRLKDGITGKTIADLDLYINGGSRFVTPSGGGCSTGFAWGNQSDNYYITAGHCIPYGLPAGSKVLLTDRTNKLGESAGSTWKDGANGGTVTLPNVGFAGDLARIKLTTRQHTASIFAGPALSGYTKREVVGKWTRSPRKGDRYCTGGYKTGEQCGWVIDDPDAVAEYEEDQLTWPVAEGSRSGKCTWPGDSGGPVYTIIENGKPGAGKVIAKGIVSGGSDAESVPAPFGCNQFFTDIRLAAKAFGGDVKKRKLS
ncbi:DNRLRE domain-containing protein [Nonomuraea sp. NPDC050680]|uniref:DNRLRE domain-containing protein n=1 Tax=Nonomuraea sp. NPDC050680 TaxID=3154630 RepID=UPI0033FB9E8E